MSRSTKPKGKVASVPERIRGGIAALLTLTCLTAAANTHSAQWAATFGIAGILYLLTTVAHVFGNMDEIEE
jgi:hypothetical protein